MYWSANVIQNVKISSIFWTLIHFADCKWVCGICQSWETPWICALNVIPQLLMVVQHLSWLYRPTGKWWSWWQWIHVKTLPAPLMFSFFWAYLISVSSFCFFSPHCSPWYKLSPAWEIVNVFAPLDVVFNIHCYDILLGVDFAVKYICPEQQAGTGWVSVLTSEVRMVDAPTCYAMHRRLQVSVETTL